LIFNGVKMSKVAICNKALALLGARKITSLADDMQEAIVLNNVYTGSLKTILSECLWHFAAKRAVLNLTTEKPVFGDGNVFALPGDIVRLFKTNLPQDCAYTIEGQNLITNADSVGIIYTFLNEADEMYPPYFTNAFTYLLAHDVSYELTGTTSKTQELLELYEMQYLPAARSKNARDVTPDKVRDSAWVDSVFGTVWG